MESILYRYSETGIFGYELYSQGDCGGKLCEISAIVSPDAPVNITGSGFAYVSGFRSDTTLVPGYTTRTILQREQNRPAGVLLWSGSRRYVLVWENTPYYIRCVDGRYELAAASGAVLIAMTRIKQYMEVPHQVQQESQWLSLMPRFRVSADAEVSRDLLAVFAAMPMLEFGL